MTVSVERARMIRGPLPDVTHSYQPRDLFPLQTCNARGRSLASGVDRCIRSDLGVAGAGTALDILLSSH